MPPPTTNWSTELWATVATDVFPAILRHPFVQGLTSGELPEECFRHYVIQDALYLRDFGRGLALLAAKAPSGDAFLMFCEHARNAIIVERALHASFLSAWNLTEADVWATPQAPNCQLYTSFLLRQVYERPYAEALAAFLPCYWIYWEVGKALVGRGSPHPLYQKWIDTYAGDGFAAVVRAVLTEADTLGQSLAAPQRHAGATAFATAARCEWLFWDMGWRRQTWALEYAGGTTAPF